MTGLLKSALGGLALGAALLTQPAAAQDWPSKAVRIVVTFAPGGSSDVVARALSVPLQKALGQPVVVENKPGGGVTIAATEIVRAAPDGYNLLMSNTTPISLSPFMMDTPPYDSVKGFTHVSLVATVPDVVMVHPSVPAKSLAELTAWIKGQDKKVFFGSGGIGSSAHLAMEAFLTQNSVQLNHIPFKGIAGAITDVAADRVDLAIGSVGSAQAYIKEGRLQGVAVSGAQRHPLLPQVPTFAESGFANYKMMYWFGLMTPNGVPKEIIDRMQKEVVHALTQAKVQEIFAAAGVKPASNTPLEFTNLVRDESALWAEVIKKAGLKSLAAQ